jgi:hypothetical protein
VTTTRARAPCSVFASPLVNVLGGPNQVRWGRMIVRDLDPLYREESYACNAKLIGPSRLIA